eukprot:CAMPEP_0170443716 /NCGR_PEP_ID=MMETSP0117_2-20130122/48129_1 /TAXON_ID=400756 /ORGANISM="Durinskia baltica, Strain CSIRO CS-38" /LENGTH=1096 /DNA_ID=CAMNT_0010704449 /DNA_START=32 /DNA_END=3322 /DNA_ORIENTATION=+
MSNNNSEKKGGSRKSISLEGRSSSFNKKQEGNQDSTKGISRQRSKTSLSKQSSGRSNKMITLSSPSMDEDVPDDVSLTLVEHSHENCLDSPLKRSVSLESDSKLEPDFACQVEHVSRDHSVKDLSAQMVTNDSVDGVREHLPPLSLSTPSRDSAADEAPHSSSIALHSTTTPNKKVSEEDHNLPAISPAHFHHSAKSPHSTHQNSPVDARHRSKSMFQAQSNNNTSNSSLQSGYTTATPAQSGQQSPLFTPLDKKLSPSQKFRSFMRNFTLDRDGDDEADGENTEGGGGGGVDADGSIKASSGSSKKAPLTPEEEVKRGNQLKARIARVQEEQAKFRRNQNMRASFASSTKGGVSPFDLTREKTKTIKTVNKGKAPSFNGGSILAGLKKAEFRATLEAGAAAMKVHQKISEDIFNENCHPMARLHKGGSNNVSTHNIDRASLAMAGFYRAPSEHSVLLTGEGYMSDEDWRITNRRDKNRRNLFLQHADKYARASPMQSNQNLEALMEATLKEHSAMFTVSDDCPDKPDVPLSYLQSSNLIANRFGWEAKDYSAPKQENLSRHKSWLTLRGVVQGAGAFTLAAAAAAPLASSGHSSPVDLNKAAAAEVVAAGAPGHSSGNGGGDGCSTATPNSLSLKPPSQVDQTTENISTGSGGGSGSVGGGGAVDKLDDASCACSIEPSLNAPVIVMKETPVHEFVSKLMIANNQRSIVPSEDADDSSSINSSSTHKLKFLISKEVPQTLALVKEESPRKHAGFVDVKPKKLIIAKEDLKSAKMKANTKEFHDRYNGLIFRDYSQPRIWQDTEDLILGKVRPHTNSVLNARSDMRWAGKTLNMYRPWSAAREEDAIDKFLHEQALHRVNSTFSMNNASAKTSPGRAGSPSSGGGNGEFFGASSAPLPRIDSMSIGSSSIGSVGGGSRGGGSRGARHRSVSPSSSITGGTRGTAPAHGTRNRSVSPLGSSSMCDSPPRNPPKVLATTGGGGGDGGDGMKKERQRVRGDSQISSEDDDFQRKHSGQSSSPPRSIHPNSVSGSVTFGNVVINSGKTHHAFVLEEHASDDVDSVLTPHSHAHQHYGSRTGHHTKRTPLLINLVKKLPSA